MSDPKYVPMSVALVNSMGSDLTVVNAARVSFDKRSELIDGHMLCDKDVKLINYLARHNHWSPFAHTSIQLRVKAPIFVARQLVKHCVTGDTLVTFCKPVKGRSNGRTLKKISDLYQMWSGKIKYQGGRKGRRNVSRSHVKAFNESTRQFESSHISDVIYQGVKAVMLVTTESGQTLRATPDHLVMTQRGWVKVAELVPSDDKLVTESLSGEPVVPTTYSRRDLDSDDVIARREHCRVRCAKCGATKELECDHIIPVSLGGDHSPENLQTLCRGCHKGKTAGEGGRKGVNAYVPRYTAVVSVSPDGVEDVYDITVEGLHNFLANGLVVHNCVGGVWNEVSRRYVDAPPEFWLPDILRQRPDASIKQGSSQEPVRHNEAAKNRVHYVCREANLYYDQLIDLGVAPEQARMVLPQNTMTEWYWTGSLMFFARVCKQRLAPGAQLETREIAEAIAEIVATLFPVSWSALMEIDHD